jgi:hypothetical protein
MKIGDIFYLPEDIIRSRCFELSYFDLFIMHYKHPLKDYVKIEICTIKPQGQNSYAKVLYDKIEGISPLEEIYVWFDSNDKLLTKEDIINIKKNKLEEELKEL